MTKSNSGSECEHFVFAVFSIASHPSLMKLPAAASQEAGGEQIVVLSTLLISLLLLQNNMIFS